MILLQQSAHSETTHNFGRPGQCLDLLFWFRSDALLGALIS